MSGFIVIPKGNILASRYPRVYKTRGIAIGAIKRNKKMSLETHEVVTYDEFDKAGDEMVTVKNLMSGKPVQIRRVDKGGPTDPSTELYWSM